jgi:hypothetical protein
MGCSSSSEYLKTERASHARFSMHVVKKDEAGGTGLGQLSAGLLFDKSNIDEQYVLAGVMPLHEVQNLDVVSFQLRWVWREGGWKAPA